MNRAEPREIVVNESRTDEDGEDSGLVVTDQPRGVQCRHILAIFCFLGLMNAYILRFDISITLVAMVNQTAVLEPSGVNDSNACPGNLENRTVSKQKDGEFDWDPETQGIILGALFYGYLVTQVPGGWISDRFSAKYPFGLAICLASILTLFTPLLSRVSVKLLIASRALEGLALGVTFPATYALLGKWVAPLEASRYGAFVFSGASLGSIVAMVVSGVLCQSDFLGGWPSVYYVFGTAGCAWFLLWLIFVYDEPAVHPRISDEERRYIGKALKNTSSTATKKSIPWRAILTSLPVWTIVIVSTFGSLEFYTLLSDGPTYLNEILKYNIESDGDLSAVPYVVSLVLGTLAGFLADEMRKRKWMSTLNTRRLFNILGYIVPGLLLISVGFIGCNKSAAVSILTFSAGLMGLTNSGAAISPLDVAPSYAGSIFGIVNTASSIAGIVGPYLVGYLTNKEQSIRQWEKVFIINSVIAIVGTLFFIVFGSATRQSWDSKGDEENEKEILINSDSGLESRVQNS